MTDPLLELKSLETEISGFLMRYQQAQMDYTNNVRNGSTINAGLDLKKMNDLNGQILQKIDRAKILAVLAIPIENKNQEKITNNIPKLKEKADTLSKEKAVIDTLLEKHDNIIGANKVISLERQSNYYKYISMFFISILMVGITLRAYFTDSTNIVELSIALVAGLLIIYNLITYFF